MSNVGRAVLLVMVVAGACLSIGCSEDSTGPDNNPPPSAGKHLWSKSFGDGVWQFEDVAADASGNVIVTGCFGGSIDFGGGALTSAGLEDIFVAKFGSDGAHLWSKRFGDGDWQIARAVSVDASGDVIVAGYFQGTVDFGGGALASAGLEDIFVAKFGSDGAHLWSKRFGDGRGQQEAQAVAVDASGNVIVTGYFYGTVDFGGGALTDAGDAAGNGDIFVAKFGSDGTHLWSKRFGDGSGQAAQAVAVDPSENVILTGYFYDGVDFGGGVLTSAGGWDIFVAKFGSDGAHVWSKRFGDGYRQGAEAIAVDASGNVILTGSFQGTVDFGGGALTSAGLYEYNIFVAKFGSDGGHLWSERFGDGNHQEARAVAGDASGNVIVTGYFYGTVDFGGGALTSAGLQDIFVAKFGSDGPHLWSKRFGDGRDHQVAQGVAVDASGNVIATGYFEGTVDFGGGEHASGLNTAMFVAKFGP